ncbi:hypothetical protein Dda3937_03943 [Dickeya dadantii 3937]|uniref:Uncharacterized protein n=1 Tax=Dickeya dadantii (strain 3937) TaxID=198628 RepID=E0SC66_DICD3|nr:hypothetical protein Dda3937_03943 [Dickeya dadantii 3937]
MLNVKLAATATRTTRSITRKPDQSACAGTDNWLVAVATKAILTFHFTQLILNNLSLCLSSPL